MSLAETTARPGGPAFRIEPAPAKLNLALHVTGRRPDGFHRLDSLVTFCAFGDEIRLSPGPLSLTVTGPFAAEVPGGEDNLCLRSARAVGLKAAISLEKRLPPAAGLGGGTADAAAVLRAAGRVPDDPVRLGADLPACLVSRPLRMQGIGEILTPLDLPPLHLVLVNPRVAVATPAVFAAIEQRDNPPLPILPREAGGGPPTPGGAPAPHLSGDAFAAWLATATRNDLEPAALRLAPVIADCIAALRAQGAVLARMSGSGATCFGVFADPGAARAAAEAICHRHPDWWVQPTETLAALSPDVLPG